ncbi:FYN-binding protein 1-like isoform X2 [Pimephales promelas]|uniref:FYN-binding protein 1-like isoform X2 n=1 Tax=Pimephales promelas TaxID=90988 RepID=UPI001955F4AE|nr:FYN-binding protein 1-like isoform X2 [Pimephales promelas]
MVACSNFRSIRAKFQEELQVRDRPVLPEKPKRLPTAGVGRSGPITTSCSAVETMSSAVETKTPSLPRAIFREDLKTPFGRRPVSFPSFPNTTSEVSRSGEDRHNRQSLKGRHLPLVLPLSNEPPHDSSAPCSKRIPSPLKCIRKQFPTPFSLTKVSASGKDMGKNGPKSTQSVETGESNPCASLERSATPSPSDGSSLTDSSSGTGSVSHFFDQHVLSTLEKAKRKLSHKSLLVCGRPKGFYISKATESPPSPPARPETSSPRKSRAAHTAVTELASVLQTGPPRKPLPVPTSLAPGPSKPPRPPRVDLHRYTAARHATEALAAEPEPEVSAPADASLEDTSLPPPEFPDFEVCAAEAADSDAVDLAALELEATEFPDSLPPPPPEEHDNPVTCSPGDDGPHDTPSADALAQATSAGVSATSDLRMNGSHTEHQQPVFPKERRVHGTFDNVYEDVETVPKFPFVQHSFKSKAAPKNPYADNGHVKEETWKNIWHVPQWSNAAEDHNGHSHNDRKKMSPEHQEDKELKKKEKQRLEKEKKEQKEKDKKRNMLHKKFKITGLEEPMYRARVLAASKLRKYDLPVKSGDLISIIRTVNCPKGKWLARDANNKYGYISVMNVELNIKEMLELGKKASQAAGRGQTDGDNLSFSSRSSHQNPVFTSSFTDDSEEWMYEDDTLSLSAENSSQVKAVSMPEICECVSALSALSLMCSVHCTLVSLFSVDSTSSAHQTFSDWSIEDVHTQEAEHFQFADVDLLPPPALYADSL